MQQIIIKKVFSETAWYNHIKWWRHGESSVMFMVFHPRPPVNVVLPNCGMWATIPHSAVSFEKPGKKPFYIVEFNRSSSLAIRSTSDIAKIANANCGMWVLYTTMSFLGVNCFIRH